MELSFSDNKLKKECEDLKTAQRAYGPDQGRVLILRANQLFSAVNMKEFAALPQVKLHPLKGKRNNQLATSLINPFRLVIFPLNDVKATDYQCINRILILEIVNYH